MAEDLTEFKKYLKKLQRIVNNDAEFNFFGSHFIKKNKIDDVWCCVLASLPEIYKKNMKTDLGKKLSSVIAYNHLFDALKRKCSFSAQMYSSKAEEVNKSIDTILATIERDVNYLEKNS